MINSGKLGRYNERLNASRRPFNGHTEALVPTDRYYFSAVDMSILSAQVTVTAEMLVSIEHHTRLMPAGLIT